MALNERGLQKVAIFGTMQDRTKVAIDHQQEVVYTLSMSTKIYDLGWPWTAITNYFAWYIFFRDHHTNVNEDRLTLSAAEM